MAREHRTYGLGESPVPQGKPIVTPLDADMLEQIQAEGGCTVCGCDTLFQVEVEIRTPRIQGGVGRGIYMGCAACPWASPMVITSKGGKA